MPRVFTGMDEQYLQYAQQQMDTAAKDAQERIDSIDAWNQRIATAEDEPIGTTGALDKIKSLTQTAQHQSDILLLAHDMKTINRFDPSVDVSGELKKIKQNEESARAYNEIYKAAVYDLKTEFSEQQKKLSEEVGGPILTGSSDSYVAKQAEVPEGYDKSRLDEKILEIAKRLDNGEVPDYFKYKAEEQAYNDLVNKYNEELAAQDARRPKAVTDFVKFATGGEQWDFSREDNWGQAKDLQFRAAQKGFVSSLTGPAQVLAAWVWAQAEDDGDWSAKGLAKQALRMTLAAVVKGSVGIGETVVGLGHNLVKSDVPIPLLPHDWVNAAHDSVLEQSGFTPPTDTEEEKQGDEEYHAFWRGMSEDADAMVADTYKFWIGEEMPATPLQMTIGGFAQMAPPFILAHKIGSAKPNFPTTAKMIGPDGKVVPFTTVAGTAPERAMMAQPPKMYPYKGTAPEGYAPTQKFITDSAPSKVNLPFVSKEAEAEWMAQHVKPVVTDKALRDVSLNVNKATGMQMQNFQIQGLSDIAAKGLQPYVAKLANNPTGSPLLGIISKHPTLKAGFERVLNGTASYANRMAVDIPLAYLLSEGAKATQDRMEFGDFTAMMLFMDGAFKGVGMMVKAPFKGVGYTYKGGKWAAGKYSDRKQAQRAENLTDASLMNELEVIDLKESGIPELAGRAKEAGVDREYLERAGLLKDEKAKFQETLDKYDQNAMVVPDEIQEYLEVAFGMERVNGEFRKLAEDMGAAAYQNIAAYLEDTRYGGDAEAFVEAELARMKEVREMRTAAMVDAARVSAVAKSKQVLMNAKAGDTVTVTLVQDYSTKAMNMPEGETVTLVLTKDVAVRTKKGNVNAGASNYITGKDVNTGEVRTVRLDAISYFDMMPYSVIRDAAGNIQRVLTNSFKRSEETIRSVARQFREASPERYAALLEMYTSFLTQSDRVTAQANTIKAIAHFYNIDMETARILVQSILRQERLLTVSEMRDLRDAVDLAIHNLDFARTIDDICVAIADNMPKEATIPGLEPPVWRMVKTELGATDSRIGRYVELRNLSIVKEGTAANPIYRYAGEIRKSQDGEWKPLSKAQGVAVFEALQSKAYTLTEDIEYPVKQSREARTNKEVQKANYQYDIVKELTERQKALDYLIKKAKTDKTARDKALKAKGKKPRKGYAPLEALEYLKEQLAADILRAQEHLKTMTPEDMKALDEIMGFWYTVSKAGNRIPTITNKKYKQQVLTLRDIRKKGEPAAPSKPAKIDADNKPTKPTTPEPPIGEGEEGAGGVPVPKKPTPPVPGSDGTPAPPEKKTPWNQVLNKTKKVKKIFTASKGKAPGPVFFELMNNLGLYKEGAEGSHHIGPFTATYNPRTQEVSLRFDSEFIVKGKRVATVEELFDLYNESLKTLQSWALPSNERIDLFDTSIEKLLRRIPEKALADLPDNIEGVISMPALVKLIEEGTGLSYQQAVYNLNLFIELGENGRGKYKLNYETGDPTRTSKRARGVAIQLLDPHQNARSISYAEVLEATHTKDEAPAGEAPALNNEIPGEASWRPPVLLTAKVKEFFNGHISKTLYTPFLKTLSGMGDNLWRQVGENDFRVGPLKMVYKKLGEGQDTVEFWYADELVVEPQTVGKHIDVPHAYNYGIELLKLWEMSPADRVKIFDAAATALDAKKGTARYIKVRDFMKEVGSIASKYNPKYKGIPTWAILYNMDLFSALLENGRGTKKLIWTTGSQHETVKTIGSGKNKRMQGVEQRNLYPKEQPRMNVYIEVVDSEVKVPDNAGLSTEDLRRDPNAIRVPEMEGKNVAEINTMGGSKYVLDSDGNIIYRQRNNGPRDGTRIDGIVFVDTATAFDLIDKSGDHYIIVDGQRIATVKDSTTVKYDYTSIPELGKVPVFLFRHNMTDGKSFGKYEVATTRVQQPNGTYRRLLESVNGFTLLPKAELIIREQDAAKRYAIERGIALADPVAAPRFTTVDNSKLLGPKDMPEDRNFEGTPMQSFYLTHKAAGNVVNAPTYSELRVGPLSLRFKKLNGKYGVQFRYNGILIDTKAPDTMRAVDVGEVKDAGVVNDYTLFDTPMQLNNLYTNIVRGMEQLIIDVPVSQRAVMFAGTILKQIEEANLDYAGKKLTPTRDAEGNVIVNKRKQQRVNVNDLGQKRLIPIKNVISAIRNRRPTGEPLGEWRTRYLLDVFLEDMRVRLYGKPAPEWETLVPTREGGLKKDATVLEGLTPEGPYDASMFVASARAIDYLRDYVMQESEFEIYRQKALGARRAMLNEMVEARKDMAKLARRESALAVREEELMADVPDDAVIKAKDKVGFLSADEQAGIEDLAARIGANKKGKKKPNKPAPKDETPEFTDEQLFFKGTEAMPELDMDVAEYRKYREERALREEIPHEPMVQTDTLINKIHALIDLQSEQTKRERLHDIDPDQITGKTVRQRSLESVIHTWMGFEKWAISTAGKIVKPDGPTARILEASELKKMVNPKDPTATNPLAWQYAWALADAFGTRLVVYEVEGIGPEATAFKGMSWGEYVFIQKNNPYPIAAVAGHEIGHRVGTYLADLDLLPTEITGYTRAGKARTITSKHGKVMDILRKVLPKLPGGETLETKMARVYSKYDPLARIDEVWADVYSNVTSDPEVALSFWKELYASAPLEAQKHMELVLAVTNDVHQLGLQNILDSNSTWEISRGLNHLVYDQVMEASKEFMQNRPVWQDTLHDTWEFDIRRIPVKAKFGEKTYGEIVKHMEDRQLRELEWYWDTTRLAAMTDGFKKIWNAAQPRKTAQDLQDIYTRNARMLNTVQDFIAYVDTKKGGKWESVQQGLRTKRYEYAKYFNEARLQLKAIFNSDPELQQRIAEHKRLLKEYKKAHGEDFSIIARRQAEDALAAAGAKKPADTINVGASDVARDAAKRKLSAYRQAYYEKRAEVINADNEMYAIKRAGDRIRERRRALYESDPAVQKLSKFIFDVANEMNLVDGLIENPKRLEMYYKSEKFRSRLQMWAALSPVHPKVVLKTVETGLYLYDFAYNELVAGGRLRKYDPVAANTVRVLLNSADPQGSIFAEGKLHDISQLFELEGSDPGKLYQMFSVGLFLLDQISEAEFGRRTVHDLSLDELTDNYGRWKSVLKEKYTPEEQKRIGAAIKLHKKITTEAYDMQQRAGLFDRGNPYLERDAVYFPHRLIKYAEEHLTHKPLDVEAFEKHWEAIRRQTPASTFARLGDAGNFNLNYYEVMHEYLRRAYYASQVNRGLVDLYEKYDLRARLSRKGLALEALEKEYGVDSSEYKTMKEDLQADVLLMSDFMKKKYVDEESVLGHSYVLIGGVKYVQYTVGDGFFVAKDSIGHNMSYHLGRMTSQLCDGAGLDSGEAMDLVKRVMDNTYQDAFAPENRRYTGGVMLIPEELKVALDNFKRGEMPAATPVGRLFQKWTTRFKNHVLFYGNLLPYFVNNLVGDVLKVIMEDPAILLAQYQYIDNMGQMHRSNAVLQAAKEVFIDPTKGKQMWSGTGGGEAMWMRVPVEMLKDYSRLDRLFESNALKFDIENKSMLMDVRKWAAIENVTTSGYFSEFLPGMGKLTAEALVGKRSIKLDATKFDNLVQGFKYYHSKYFMEAIRRREDALRLGKAAADLQRVIDGESVKRIGAPQMSFDGARLGGLQELIRTNDAQMTRRHGMEQLPALERAAFTARESLIDYGNPSSAVARWRNGLFPFATWYFKNFSDCTKWLVNNGWDVLRAASLSKSTRAPAIRAISRLAVSMAIMAIPDLWNNSDEERQQLEHMLPPEQRLLPHFIFNWGVNEEDGGFFVYKLQHPFAVALNMTGLTYIPVLMHDVDAGIISEDTATHILQKKLNPLSTDFVPYNQLLAQVNPFIRAPFEVFTNRNTYTGQPIAYMDVERTKPAEQTYLKAAYLAEQIWPLIGQFGIRPAMEAVDAARINDSALSAVPGLLTGEARGVSRIFGANTFPETETWSVLGMQHRNVFDTQYARTQEIVADVTEEEAYLREECKDYLALWFASNKENQEFYDKAAAMVEEGLVPEKSFNGLLENPSTEMRGIEYRIYYYDISESERDELRAQYRELASENLERSTDRVWKADQAEVDKKVESATDLEHHHEDETQEELKYEDSEGVWIGSDTGLTYQYEKDDEGRSLYKDDESNKMYYFDTEDRRMHNVSGPGGGGGPAV